MRSVACKRGMDLMGAAFGLALLAPVLLGAALLIRLTMGSPVLFRQVRSGLHDRPFTMYKFCTMLDLGVNLAGALAGGSTWRSITTSSSWRRSLRES